jgi:hypothetical protein
MTEKNIAEENKSDEKRKLINRFLMRLTKEQPQMPPPLRYLGASIP